MLFPMPAAVPPHEPVNHSATAPDPDVPPTDESVVVVPSQMIVVPLTLVGATDNVLTVTGKLAEIIPFPQAFVP